MRICYLADGRYIHAHRWLKFFSGRGHEMSLISFAPVERPHIRSIEEAGAHYWGELEPFHLKRGWRTLNEIRRLRQLFRREKIDILHSHFLGVNAWYAAISGFHPMVITVMGGDILGEHWKPGPDIRERWLTPYALRKADLITCWSNKLTDVVKRYSRPAIPVEVIHGGVDTDRFCPGPKPDDLREQLQIPSGAKVVLSPRLMRPLYNLDKVALAASEVWAKIPNAYFLFAVLPEAKDPVYEQRVRAILNQDANNRVHFLDAIPHDRMADYYRLADVTISIPSSDGTPMSVLESLACETPVVVSDIPQYDPVYIEANRTVLMADADSVASIATSIVRALTDAHVSSELAAEGRRRVKAHGSYLAQMSRMEDLYYSLVPGLERSANA
jgi:glycosyltransferase involved in cell wall biosynthesis